MNDNQQTIKENNGGSGSQSPSPPQQLISPKSEISNVRFSVPKPETSIFSSPTAPIYPLTTFNHLSQTTDHEMKVVRPLSTSSGSSKSIMAADFDLNNNNDSSSSLSLKLSLSMSASDLANSRHSSAFQVVQGFKDGFI